MTPTPSSPSSRVGNTPLRAALSRRTLLRGSFGGAAVTLGLPALEAMLNRNGTALANGRPLPRRFGVFFWGNGVRHKFWIPDDCGANWSLSAELQPLEGVKPYVNLVTGFDVKTGNEQGHHAGTVGMLSGRPMVSQPHPSSAYASTFSGPSIDQIAAAAIGSKTAFASLELGISPQVTENEGTTLLYLSHRGPDAPNPPEYDPRRVFQRLFGPGALEPERRLQKSVLDVVAEDARVLQRTLGTRDRRRMDQHLTDLRAVERRLLRSSPAATCAMPAAPAATTPKPGAFPHAERTDEMARLLALALACDRTRVFSFQFSGSVAETTYWEVGEDKAHHQFTHDEPGDQPIVHAATTFVMKQFATLLGLLQSTPDGAGNLLDSSAIVATSDTADGRAHSLKDYPIVVAGRAGGALRYPGVHHRSDRGDNTSHVLLTLLRSVGVRLDRFGHKGGAVKDGLSAIEA